MRRICLYLTMLLLAVQLHSQITFNLRDRYDFPACVLTSILPTDSCYYATGLIADTLFPYNAGAIFLRLSLDGEMQMLKTVKSTVKTYELWYNSLALLPDGTFSNVGHVLDTTFKTILIKYGQLGDTVFMKEFINPYYPDAKTISPEGGAVVLPDGGTVILNRVSTQINVFGNDTNYYIVRTDSLGNKVWDKLFGTPKWERPESILLAPDGGVICGGTRTNETTNVQNFTFECHIFKLDADGNYEWEYTSPLGAGLRDAANAMLLLDDGSLIVASGVGHEQQHPSVNEVWFDRHVFKLDPQRQVEWELTFPDTELSWYSRTTNLVNLMDGSGYVLAGMVRRAPPNPSGYGVIEGWLAKISPDGDSIWTRRYAYPIGPPAIHEIYDMKETPDGGLILCGMAKDISEDATYPQQGWLLKLDKYGCLVPGCHLSDAISDVAPITETKLTIYPNPTSGYLNFYVGSPLPIAGTPKEGAEFRIVNASGQVVEEFKAGSLAQTFIIPIHDWQAGAYWLQVLVGGEIIATEPFIKN